jgi:hypothetical protein
LTLSEWLSSLKSKAGIEHKVIGNHIILVDRKQPEAVTISNKKPVSANQKTAANKSKLSSGARVIKESERSVNMMSPLKKDSADSLDPAAISADTVPLLFTDSQGTGSILTFISASAASKPSVTYSKLNTRAPVTDEARSASKGKGTSDAFSGSYLSPLSKIDLGPQGVGVSFERKLGRRTIIDLSLGLGGGYAITGKQFKYKVDGLSGPDIYASVNPRIYYNSQKRLSKGKSIERNAGNYIGFRMKYVTDALAENFVVWDAVLFNVHWGVQRPVGRRWVFNGHIGPGYGFAHSFIFGNRLTGLNHAYPSIELKMSYVFSRLAE